MFGKTMSVPDAALDEWIRLAGAWQGDELRNAIEVAKTDPYRAKRALGRRIVELYHDPAAAQAAEAHFDRLFRDHAAPEDMPEVTLPVGAPALRMDESGAWLPGLLVAAGLAASKCEAMRLIEQGAVSVDGTKVTDRNGRVPARPGAAAVVQRGKRHFARVRFEG